ncbi:hypothetical protein [Maledivibacter halophilus]|uniref:hypothetical protein n=1 Tax=Maledivibacter halophilus TaxID=36842 RepID=UPI0014832072|nr:hypothetical protein [Maledivibacter halophilus]
MNRIISNGGFFDDIFTHKPPCGDRRRNTEERIYEIAVFTRALEDFKFVKNG